MVTDELRERIVPFFLLGTSERDMLRNLRQDGFTTEPRRLHKVRLEEGVRLLRSTRWMNEADEEVQMVKLQEMVEEEFKTHEITIVVREFQEDWDDFTVDSVEDLLTNARKKGKGIENDYLQIWAWQMALLTRMLPDLSKMGLGPGDGPPSDGPGNGPDDGPGNGPDDGPADGPGRWT